MTRHSLNVAKRPLLHWIQESRFNVSPYTQLQRRHVKINLYASGKTWLNLIDRDINLSLWSSEKQLGPL